MHLKKIFILILLITRFTTFASEDTENKDSSTFYIESLLANLSSTYITSPGDIYQIQINLGNGDKQDIECFVDNDFNINLSFLGKINVRDKDYKDVKKELQEKVLESYPNSFINVYLLTITGIKITVAGEINKTEIISAIGIERLSEIIEKIEKKLTNFANLRNIEIKRSNGDVEIYDLFKFYKEGDYTQNPFVKHNDIITINKTLKKVDIIGEVERPGNYSLLETDTLADLINSYGNGFTKLADTRFIEVQRIIKSDGTYKEQTLYYNSEDENLKNIKLEDYDKVTIPNRINYSGSVTIRGAIVNMSKVIAEDITSKSGIQSVSIISGNKFSSIMDEVKVLFLMTSDLKHAYIKRNNEIININIEEIMHNINSEQNIVLMDKDQIIIPFKELTVYINGGVTTPGMYPFIDDKPAKYYISMAGGFDRTKNLFNNYYVTDSEGRRVNKNMNMEPEYMIWVRNDNPLVYITEYGSWISTILTAILVSIQLYNLAPGF
ncbi:MAG: SLBB domain-containing protein [Spirochaetales bacterium]|nr:SLBB domain-containing protein [Spirochaetales bacterium]